MEAGFVRSWDSLSLRLTVSVGFAAFGVLGAFWWSDFRQMRTTLLTAEVRKLREEAKVLGVAQRHLPTPFEFQQFVDHFCEQMSAAASPGHHIAVFDADGAILVRAHTRGNRDLESAMARHRNATAGDFVFAHTPYLTANADGVQGTKIVVAQSLAPVRAAVQAQAVSRAWSMGALALAIMAVNVSSVALWVHRPLRGLVRTLRAVGRGDFAARVRPGGSREIRFLVHRLNEVAAALEHADRGRRLQMRRARKIQHRLLPQERQHLSGYDVAAAFEPAESVGGDFYDIVPLADGSVLMVILDVCGHGVPAALHTALLRTVLRYEARTEADPALLAAAMNREFLPIADTGEFATCFLVRLLVDGGIQFASAGHPPATVLRRDGSIELLDAEGPVLGLADGLTFETGRSVLRPDDALFLCTDGLYEIAQTDGGVLGRTAWVNMLRGLSEDLRRGDLHAVVARMRACSATGRFDDDVTLLRVCRRQG